MQGITIQNDEAGKPAVLTVNLQHHDERLTAAVADLLREVGEIQRKQENAFWEATASDALRQVWDTPENEAWDTFYHQEQAKRNAAR